MNSLFEKETPLKSYYVLGTNWYCYVEPSESDRELLNGEDFLVEICTKGIEAYFGERYNDTLTVIDKEVDPMIGVLMVVTEKGYEENENKFNYIPSFFPLGNNGKYKQSQVALAAYADFRKDIEESIKKSNTKKKKISKKDKPDSPNSPPIPEI